ncbi:MAG: hypothetical protein Q9168_002893 [Polycauliona sp. 1 TL-2023]
MSSSLPTPDPGPDEKIQRILFVSPNIHIYTIPPLTTTKGYTTTGWSPLIAPTASNPTPAPITTRLRVLETSSTSTTSSSASSEQQQGNSYNITTAILLEDPTSGDLFAAAPYTSPSSVEAVLDSARFFAVRVEGEGGRRAVLGIGFEDRSEAIDFGICLQEVRKVMGLEKGATGGKNPGAGAKAGKRGGAMGGAKGLSEKEMGKKASWSLKEGEMIKVEIGGMGVKRKEEQIGEGGGGQDDGGEGALFSIKPPSHSQSSGGMPFLPPPPSAQAVKAERRKSRGPVVPEEGSAADLGFDDGEFGEFQ